MECSLSVVQSSISQLISNIQIILPPFQQTARYLPDSPDSPDSWPDH